MFTIYLLMRFSCGIQFDVQDKQRKPGSTPQGGSQRRTGMEGGQLQFLSQGGTAQRGTDLGKNFRVVVTNCNPIQAISLFSLLIGETPWTPVPGSNT